MTDEPTNAELMATALAVLAAGRDLIQRADRTSCRDMGETLDALSEGLATAGGSLLHLADRLGLTDEATGLVREAMSRFLTCAPNAEVKAVHPKAMPVILTRPDEWEAWLTAPWELAAKLQRPLPDGALRLVAEAV